MIKTKSKCYHMTNYEQISGYCLAIKQPSMLFLKLTAYENKIKLNNLLHEFLLLINVAYLTILFDSKTVSINNTKNITQENNFFGVQHS